VSSGAVFISYRRQDAPGYAGRLYDALATRFGDARVFMDVGAIEPGADFGQRIDEALESCDVLLAVIGPRWATVTGADGQRRLAEPDDFVSLEVGTALKRSDVKVIPVLVDGATMPAQHELPQALTALGRRQALELSDGRWRYDVERLIATVEPVLERDVEAWTRWRVDRERRASRAPIAAVVATVLAVGPAYLAYQTGLRVPQDSTQLEIARLAAAWAGFWAVVALAVAVATGLVGPPLRSIAARGFGGLCAGLIAGALGGGANGALRYQSDQMRLGIVVGFVVTGAIIGLARIAGRSSFAGFCAGAAAGAVSGWLVTSLGATGLISQALPAVIIVGGIAALDLARGSVAAPETSAGHQSPPPLRPSAAG
jgi:TIR domain